MMNKTTHKIFEDKVDKLFHDAFANENSTTTSTEWQSLQQRLDANNKTFNWKRFGILSCLFFLLGSGITYLVMQQNINQNNTISKKIITTPSTIETNSLATNQESLNPNSKNEIIENAVTANFEKAANSNQIIENNNYTNSKNLNSKSNANNILQENDILQNTIYTKKINTTLQLHKEKNNSQLIVTDGAYSNSFSSTSFSNQYIDNTENVNSNNLITNFSKFSIVSNISLQEISFNQLLKPNSKIIYNANIPIIVKKEKREKLPKAVPEHYFENEKTYYIEAFSGMQNSIKNSNTFAAFLAPNGYNSMRLQQENTLTSAAAGIQFKVRKNHIVFGSGLQYLQLGDAVHYDTSFNRNSFVKNANGRTTFSYIEVPFMAGYENSNKHWGFTMQAGFSTGILTQLTGSYVSIQNFNTQLFNVKENKKYFKTAIFNLIVSPQVQYYLNNKTNIFVAPTYKKNLQAITKIDADLKQRYQVLGMNIGIRTSL